MDHPAQHYWTTSDRLPRFVWHLETLARHGGEGARVLYFDLARFQTQVDKIDELNLTAQRDRPDRGEGVSSIAQQLRVLLDWMEDEPANDADSTAYQVETLQLLREHLSTPGV